MPCYDPDSSPRANAERHQREIDRMKDQLEQRDAMLCAVLTTMRAAGVITVLSRLNEREAGITAREIAEWWMRRRHHEDEQRRQRELKQRHERFLKKMDSFRAALTEEEIRWLNDEQTKTR